LLCALQPDDEGHLVRSWGCHADTDLHGEGEDSRSSTLVARFPCLAPSSMVVGVVDGHSSELLWSRWMP
jgi:hypothetical protein